ncbi:MULTISPECIES: GNAT family N-acetyltransferase [unclassified Sporolactobacillus]|uniref:GNAT family N-acetyltransferase n=1 Tax=unclassified Sporolactobacillus TaxID=2628533 RepID=UPI0023678EC2|nr:GNAT family N-acetyltransferase [Sporolactobacillus sp. CQH2019]MDD9147181.1 GNAT family N-acetyltransferase [Sporolactobacillus sp. CQH2019]
MAVIRKMTAADTEAFLRFNRILGDEAKYMPFAGNECPNAAAPMHKRLKETEKSVHSAWFAAEHDGQLIGFTAVLGDGREQIRHRARTVTAVLQAWRRLGYGRLLLEKAESWAKENDIFRLELTVMSVNRPGMLLYGTAGYQVEGTRKAAVVLDGKRVDEFYMAKLLQ